VELVEEEAKTGDAPAATASAKKSAKSPNIQDPQDLSLGKGLSQLPHWNHCGKVKERPLQAGAWNPMKDGAVSRGERAVPMGGDFPWETPAPVWRSHVDRAIDVFSQLP